MSASAYTQDLITKKDGTEIQAKVLEVTPVEVKFKRFDNQAGPLFTILRTDIYMIKYENGTNAIFDQVEFQNNPESNSADAFLQANSNNGNLCLQAEQDANKNYEAKHSGKGWTCATAILTSPLLALIPAAICAGIEPKESNLKYPLLI